MFRLERFAASACLTGGDLFDVAIAFPRIDDPDGPSCGAGLLAQSTALMGDSAAYAQGAGRPDRQWLEGVKGHFIARVPDPEHLD